MFNLKTETQVNFIQKLKKGKSDVLDTRYIIKTVWAVK